MIRKFTLLAMCLLPLVFVASGTAQVAPPAPENLTVIGVMGGAVLNWDTSATAIGYRVYKAVDTLPFVRIAMVMMHMFIDPMVPPGHIYRYYVTAYNHTGESLPSNDVTFTPGGPPPVRHHGFITGTILDDSTHQPIPCVRIRFFKPYGCMFFREARTDNLGRYIAPLDSGSYLVYATKWPYIPEWYDDALRFEDATPVLVTPKDTSTANFGLRRIPPPPPPVFVSLSGTVTDSSTGQPLKGAYVLIMRTNRQISVMDNYEGSIFGTRDETFFLPGMGTLVGVLRATRTDSLGHYSFTVLDKTTYILLAFKENYLPEFYDDKKSPYDADRVFVQGNTAGIDFDLIPNPVVQNSLAGQVKDNSGNGVMAKVVIFKKSPFMMFPMRFAITDSLGNYFFPHLFAGTYYAKAVPVPPYAPAWYSLDSCGAKHWADADSFLVSGNTTGIDICVKAMAETPGFALIGGTVTDEGTGTGVQGATVYALSATSGEVVGYDITENDGSFILPDVSPGSYKLSVDMEGYGASETSALTVDAANNYTITSAQVNIKNVILGVGKTDNITPASYSLSQNYPNPFNPTTQISFSVPVRSRVTISVYNLLGQLVTSLLGTDLAAGNYSIQWNGLDGSGKSVTSGVYFYTMKAEAAGSASFTSIRKMLLVK